MRERPTIVLLHPGPGFDHGPFKVQIGPLLAERAQVLYLDMRGAGRSDPGRPEDHRVERWADDVHGFCEALHIERPIVLGLGFGGIVALDYAARYPDHPGALVLIAPVARMVPERSIEVYERLGGAEAAEIAERFYGDLDGRGFADFVRVCFPLLSTHDLIDDVIVRAHWSPEVLVNWMRGEAKELDLRDVAAARPRAGARARRRGRRLRAARVGSRGRGAARRGDGVPQRARSEALDHPGRPGDGRGAAPLPRPARAGAGREGARERGRALLRRRGNVARRRRPLDARAADDRAPADRPGPRPLALQGARRAGARARRAGGLSRPARIGAERLELRGALDARHVGRGCAAVLRRGRAAATVPSRDRRRRSDRGALRRAASRARRAARPRQHGRALQPHARDRGVRPARRPGRRRGGGAVLRQSDRGVVRRVHARVRAAVHAPRPSRPTSSRGSR